MTQELSEVKFHADDELLKKIEKLKGLLAHKHPNVSIAELFHKLCDLGIEKFDPGVKVEIFKNSEQEKRSISKPTEKKSMLASRERRALIQDSAKTQTFENQDSPTQRCRTQNPTQLLSSPAPARVTTRQNWKRNEVKIESAPVKTHPKPLSKAALDRAVWQKAESQCENCKSTYALQIDHITPKAFGGLDTLKNLRLLCRHCNQRAAIAKMGLGKMERHFQAQHK